jgi:long-subunit fatty acid transport protein
MVGRTRCRIDRIASQVQAPVPSRVVAWPVTRSVTVPLWRAVGVLALLVALPASPAWGSQLLAPAIGGLDSSTQGTRIADPPTPSAALFENPAGLAWFDTTTDGGGAAVSYGRQHVATSAPADYSDTNYSTALIPDFGFSVPYRRQWRFAAGNYGTTGSTFDFHGDPSLGIGDYFSETVVIAFPLGVAYRLNDQVAVGAELQPLFGQLRTHFPAGGLDFNYKINGPGVQGMFGVAYRPSETWALGAALRTPGMIWMGGSMPVPNLGRQRVSCNAQVPAQLFLGATWDAIPRLILSGSVRFTNSSSLGESMIEYELTPQANSGFLPDGKDEWKFALGAEYRLLEHSKLLGGVSWANHIVGAQGVSPLVFDGDDTKLSLGASQEFGRWEVNAMVGYGVRSERHVSAANALILPGAYSMGGEIFFLGVTHRWPASDT